MLPFSSKLIELSPENRAFNAALRGEGEPVSSKWQPAEGKLRETLISPEKHDPLSFSATETLLKVANATKANCVAALPDLMVYGSSLTGNVAAALKLRLEGGWLNASPSDYGTRLARIPRRVLGAFAREIDRTGATSLEAQLGLAQSGPATTSAPGWLLPRSYEHALGAPASMSISPVAAVLYHGLSASQLEALDQGRALRFEDLSLQTRASVHRLIIISPRERLLEAPDSGLAQPSPRSLRAEATQIWPQTVPEEATIRAVVSKSTCFVNLDSSPRLDMGIIELGHSLAQLSKGTVPHYSYAHSNRLLLGETIRIQFQVRHSGLLFQTAISGIRIPAGALAKPYKELPSEVRKPVEEMKGRILAIGG